MPIMKAYARRLCRSIAICASALAMGVAVRAQSLSYDISPGDLEGALSAYAEQSGAQLVYRTQDIKGLTTQGLRRSASAEQALHELLAGTTLKARRDASGAFVIFASTRAAKSAAPSASAGPRQ